MRSCHTGARYSSGTRVHAALRSFSMLTSASFSSWSKRRSLDEGLSLSPFTATAPASASKGVVLVLVLVFVFVFVPAASIPLRPALVMDDARNVVATSALPTAFILDASAHEGWAQSKILRMPLASIHSFLQEFID